MRDTLACTAPWISRPPHTVARGAHCSANRGSLSMNECTCMPAYATPPHTALHRTTRPAMRQLIFFFFGSGGFGIGFYALQNFFAQLRDAPRPQSDDEISRFHSGCNCLNTGLIPAGIDRVTMAKFTHSSRERL